MDVKITKFDISRLSGNRTFDPALAGYEDSIDIIEDELQNLRKSFVKIGWYLKHINKEKMYQKDGYDDIFEFAYAKFKMSKGTVNRLINLCINFSVGHDSPELDKHYQEFDQSQLFEMLPMNEGERKEITPDMTVKQIREKKAEQRARKEPPDKLIAEFCKNYDRVRLNEFDSASQLRDYYIDKHGKSHSCGGPDPNFNCTPRGISLGNYDEITWLTFARRAWGIFAYPVVQKAGYGDEAAAMSDPEGNVPGQTIAFGEAADSNFLNKEYTASDKKEPYGSSAPISRCGDEVLGETGCTVLMEEACSLSQKLCEGFRFSARNNTLSQMEKFREWAIRLNNIVYTLYGLYESL